MKVLDEMIALAQAIERGGFAAAARVPGHIFKRDDRHSPT
jgi:hypothetical protein